MTKILMVLSAIIIYSTNLYSLQLSVDFSKRLPYGTYLEDFGYSLCRTYDSNYVIMAWTNVSAQINSQYRLVKVNQTGNILWDKVFGDNNGDPSGGRISKGIIETPDHGFLLSGQSYNAFDVDIKIVKADSIGNQLWTRLLSEPGNQAINKLAPFDSKTYLMCGYNTNGGFGKKDVYVSRIDTAGLVLWNKNIGGSEDDEGSSICLTEDSTFLVIGKTKSFPVGSLKLYLIKFRSNGDTVWSKTYEGSGWSIGKSAIFASDSTYMICGSTNSYNFCLKLNQDGDTIFTRSWGAGAEVADFIHESKPGIYFIWGSTTSILQTALSSWYTCMNNNGDTLWNQVVNYGNDVTADQRINDVIPAFGSGYMTTGAIKKLSEDDLWLMKMDTMTPLMAPTLNSPTNNSINLPISTSLNWNLVNEATSYEVLVATKPTFSNCIFQESNITTNSQTISGLFNDTIYYWKVRAKNSIRVSSWSSVYSFKTITTAPEIPSLCFPPNDTINMPFSIKFIWHKADRAAFYRLQVSADNGFTNILKDQSNISDTFVTVSGLPYYSKYFWRVADSNIVASSYWSNERSYSTILPDSLIVPQIISPSNGAIDVVLNSKAIWHKINNARYYYISYSTNSSLYPGTYVPFITDTFTTFVGLKNAKKYYWRINCELRSNTEVRSPIYSFTTVYGVPEIVTPVAPMKNATNVSLNPAFIWNTAERGITYRIVIAEDSTFSNPLLDTAGFTDTSITTTLPSRNTTYYWRISSYNDSGYGQWSTICNFKSIPFIPSTPVPISPKNDSTGIAINWATTLRWDSAASAVSYQVQFGIDSTFSTMIKDSSNVTRTSCNVGFLQQGCTYFWRIAAWNGGGRSAWSPTFKFETIPSVPDAPILFSPEQNSIVNQNTVLKWHKVFGATSYRIQVAQDSLCYFFLLDSSGIVDTSFLPPFDSRYVKTYYWHVSAKNVSGMSEWSQIYKYNIIPPPSRPVPFMPARNETEVATALTIWWSGQVTGDSRLQIANDSDFNTIILDTSKLPNMYVGVTGLTNSSRYFWRVSTTNAGGTSAWSLIFSFTTVGSLTAEKINYPNDFLLGTCSPNPFNPSIRIEYGIPNRTASDEIISIDIFSIQGKLVRHLVREKMQPGYHQAIWNGKDESGVIVTAGYYFCLMKADGYNAFRKIIFMK